MDDFNGFDDEDDEKYIECSICHDEYCEEELGDLEMRGTWIENVCDDCRDRYAKELKDFLDEMHEEFDDRFREGGY